MKPLPIDAILPDLKTAIRRNPAVVLQAPPGSGKTTRVPLALLDVIAASKGRIVMLEPRRIAAVSAARWMAREMGEDVGRTLGYSIRFDSRISEDTRIEVVTEGILTRRMLADPTLEGVAAVIFDEFHERGLQADLALALCLDIRKSLREDLKIVVMSATLDCGPVAALLGDAPVITAGGESFPVEERYGADTRREAPLEEEIAVAVRAVLQASSGDLLVFLPGAGEIRRSAELLETWFAGPGAGVTVHPLYGDLPFEEQERAIVPSGRRKIILATNIAETSLTIEGIGAVIDCGLTRRLRHDPATGMNRLVTVPVSRASAEQRKGRAGRLGPGVCYRLYSRHTFESMVSYAPPEILVSDLSSLVLDLAVWGVSDPAALSWMDRPPAAAWEAARRLLMDLGALDAKGFATRAGRDMARLPLHPRLGRLLLKAQDQHDPRLGADLAALLSERDIFPRRPSGAMARSGGPDVGERLDALRQWRRDRKAPAGADPWVLKAVDRVSGQLMGLLSANGRKGQLDDDTLIAPLLLHAYPDRIAKRRDEGNGRFLLSQGRGVRFPSAGRLAESPYIVAVHVDGGEKAEGRIHLAEAVSETLLRREMASVLETRRRVEWDKQEGRIASVTEERIGAIVLSSRSSVPNDGEAVPLLCEAIRNASAILAFSREARQFQGRVALLRRAFPEENWPDLSDEALLVAPEQWLAPWLSGIRSQVQLSGLDLLPALHARLAWDQKRLLDDRAPGSLIVPSGSRISIDYASGETPVLAVKLQEMFGLADTPLIAAGRVKLLLHLLSPARRPVQITQDLKAFWNSGYVQVKKELRGRYPRHPWPDDPWNALPTKYTTARSHRQG